MHNIEDSYPLAPMQQGMLFHSLYAEKAWVDIEQMIISLHERVDAPALVKAWQCVVDRHAVMQTSFRWENLDEPVQEFDLPRAAGQAPDGRQPTFRVVNHSEPARRAWRPADANSLSG